MKADSQFEKLLPLLRQFWIPLGFLLLGLLFLSSGLIWYLTDNADKAGEQDILFEAASTSRLEKNGSESDVLKENERTKIVVDVGGGSAKAGGL
jgi:hypothetical protein